MAYVKVKQLNDKAFNEMNCIFDDSKRFNRAISAIKNNEYKIVADLVLGGNTDSILNQAFRATNSIDCAWYKNTDILVDLDCREGCRSTSIGDIIEFAGNDYVVMGSGFKLVEEKIRQ